MTGTELEARQEAIAALQAKQEAEFEGDSFTTPILKLCQPLTKEVQEDEAEAGEFLNTATGETLGDSVNFIIAYYQKGRSARDKKSGDYYIAFGDTIPASWEPLVGDEWVGTLFTEYPDAEEQYRERVNRKEIEWEKGPLVSTTYNYTGYVIVPGIEDDDPDELQPVRLSLQRSNKKAADKINTIRRSVLRGKALWDIVFEFSTARKTFTGGTSYVLNAKAGRKTTDEEKYAAAELAIALDAGRVSTTGEPGDGSGGDAPAAEAPDAKGGLAV
jgi:hypothetical protein